jgi:hypothetical protein
MLQEHSFRECSSLTASLRAGQNLCTTAERLRHLPHSLGALEDPNERERDGTAALP